jgi:hypothetical protein
MTLLAEVIESHGGADLWRQLRRFSARMSVDGVLLADKGKADTLKDVVVDGSTRDQFLRITDACNASFVYERRSPYLPRSPGIGAADDLG